MKFIGQSGEIVKSNAIAGDDFVIEYANICRQMQEKKREWIEILRSDGVKAAHPDDGWVNREENKVHLTYPQFNDGVGIGDRIALGTPTKWRIVEVTGIEQGMLPLLWYTFTAC
jgi:hypothetical protein